MSYTNINNPSLYFNTKLYTGNGSTQSIVGINFQPDFTWIKRRTTAGFAHRLTDAVRGVTKEIYSNSNDAEATATTGLTSFDSDGFTVNTNNAYNASGVTYVGWNWLAGNGTSSNTDGSITSTVSANTTSGFSIVSYTGNGTAGATIGHGLNAVPSMVIVKRLDGIANWVCYHSGIGATKYIELNTTTVAQLQSSYNMFNSTAPSSSLVTLGDIANTNGNTNTYIAYCFAEKKGFSKFGSYTGNGSTDGTFVYTGFKTAWILVKRTDAVSDWFMYDTTRDPLNPNTLILRASTDNAEANDVGYSEHDHLSNGFKLRQTWDGLNASGGTYIYMAFAQHPLVSSSGVPCTAR